VARSRIIVVALVALVFGFGALAWTFWTLLGRYDRQIYTPASLAEVPETSVAIVFGAGYWSNGALSTILRERLDASIELYEAGEVKKLLFSGDNRVADYNEPAKMLEYALSQGVPREDIVLDYAGRRTYDTCYRARDIFAVTEATLVTQQYHLPRALETCRVLGVDAIGYSANRYEHQGYYLIFYRLREIPALWKTWWDLFVARPEPVLGDPLPILGFESQEKGNSEVAKAARRLLVKSCWEAKG
jgi:SanA protein